MLIGFPNNWADDKYTYLCGDINKFSYGKICFRPVDKVFFLSFLQKMQKKGLRYIIFREKILQYVQEQRGYKIWRWILSK